jgi:hypothetical protein
MPLRCTRRINNKTSALSRIGDCHLMIIIASKPAPDVEMIAAAWPMRWPLGVVSVAQMIIP